MSDTFLNITLFGEKELEARFQRLPTALLEALLKKMNVITADLRNYIITDKLSGQVLNKRTGRLQQSIQRDVSSSDLAVTGKVFSAGDAKAYAGAHEFGAHIPERTPVKAKALAFMVGGKQVFAMRAKAFNLPERSFLRSSLRDKAQEISGDLREAIQEAIHE